MLTSGAHRVGTAKVTTLVGAGRGGRRARVRARRHRAADRRRRPGRAPGPLRTLLDRALEASPRVGAAGGIPHAVFPATFAELVAVTGGEPADVA
ncbi:hypothetical protein ACVGVM_04745 [Pseudonocardia bannensis]|uniref:hypothetical protein n=1 Tax=Pseudonocardia bannensis TaxID=630973 RepID=UPI001FE36B0F|nr:hypothetical protein [Pseudonocardia bannensis]